MVFKERGLGLVSGVQSPISPGLIDGTVFDVWVSRPNVMLCRRLQLATDIVGFSRPTDGNRRSSFSGVELHYFIYKERKKGGTSNSRLISLLAIYKR